MSEKTDQSATEKTEFLQNGTIVDQRYEVLQTLSYGDSRAVYLCRLLSGNQKEVAMKTLHKPRAGEDFSTTAKRFRTELFAAYEITHPNVVHVYEFIEHPHFLAYTMEYVDGGNLEQMIGEDTFFGIQEKRECLSQICAGLHAIHQKGIIHRELKPRNILLTKDKVAKISDFGVARVEKHTSLTIMGGLVGTMDYLSPEYITEGKLSKSLDIYSVGVIGYQLITGELPFKSKDLISAIKERLSCDPEPPSSINPACSPGLSDIVMRALSRAEEDRFESADEMARALDKLSVKTAVSIDSNYSSETRIIDRSTEFAPGSSSLNLEGATRTSTTGLDGSDFSPGEFSADASSQGVEGEKAESKSPWDAWSDEGILEKPVKEAIPSYFESQEVESSLFPSANDSEENSLEILSAIQSGSVLATDTIRGDLKDSIFEDVEFEEDFEEDLEETLFAPVDSTVVPTVSSLHRAIDEQSNFAVARRRSPKLVMAVAFVASMALGITVNVGTKGSTERAVADAVSGSRPISGLEVSDKPQKLSAIENDDFLNDIPESVTPSIRDPQPVNAVDTKRSKLMSKDKEEGAINEYQLLLSLNPGDPKVNYNLGLLYVGRGEFETAEKYLSEAVRLDPENATAAYYLRKVKRKLSSPS